MKNILTAILLLMHLANVDILAQYRGGTNDGFYVFESSVLNQLPTFYNGGVSDGFQALLINEINGLPDIAKGGSNDGFSTISVFGLNEMPQISRGGTDDGFHSVEVVHLNQLPEIYSGGSNDGYDLLSSEALNLLPEIYSGGVNDGYDLVERNHNNLPCTGDLFVWTGEVNEEWHESGNWECRVAPNLYSEVIIPEGLTSSGRLYPVVYLAAEVSTITLHPGSYLQIEPGVVMRLNGN